MGIEPFLAASTVLAVVAQRLGRRLCKNCKTEMPTDEIPSRELLLEAGYKPHEVENMKLWKPVGCSLCSAGYKGRFALVEAMEMTDKLRKVIIAGASTIELRKAAIECGMVTLRRAGLMNAMRGVTSLEEVMRHTVGEDIGSDEGPAKGKKKVEAEEVEEAPAST
jgi:type IV pilus assembly protein PilB